MMAPQITINHLLKSMDKSDLLETGMNFRFRDKNCTLIYYTHQPKEKNDNKFEEIKKGLKIIISFFFIYLQKNLLFFNYYIKNI